MEAVCGSVLSTTLQVLFDRIAQNLEFLVGLFPGNKKLQLNRLIRVLLIVSPVLQDAENKQEKSSATKAWFNSIRHAVYQADDVLDEINTERLRINQQHSKGDLTDNDFSDQFIGELSPTLEEICDALERNVQRIGLFGLRILYGNQKREDKRLSTSVVNKTEIFGRDDEKEKIIQMVLSVEGCTDICVIPIIGMGGIGKTTLAQLVYNDERVNNLFQTRAWVCISEEFDVYRTTKDLLMKVNSSVVVDEKDDLSLLQLKLKDNLQGKRFIIVLDDIWNENYDDCQHLMSPLNSGCRGSKIIVTTRNENIALMLQTEPFHRLNPITDDQSWSLFQLHASDNRSRSLSGEFQTIGRRIMEKCKGLPLAIKTIASALRSKSSIHEWRDILNSENWMVVGDILPALSLSYKLIPSHLKCCFAFCAVFFKDIPFDKDEVALLWMANDLVQPSSQKVAHKYFEELRSRSFFDMVHVDKYVMHNLVNDLARIVSGNFCARQEDYQLENLHLGIQGKNNLPPREVLHFSYMASEYDTLKRFRGLAQGLRTFYQSGREYSHIITLFFSHISTLFFSHILPKLRHVRALSLHHCSFGELIPYSIGHLKHLRYLNLAETYIVKLPNGIHKCLNLQTLILAGCRAFQKLPEDMRLLISLQHLNVSGCWSLEKLPEDIELLINLQHLDLSHCLQLKELPKYMGGLINQQHLDKSHCSQLKELPKYMGGLLNLQHLDISHCSELKALPKYMGGLINLQHLDISHCSKLKDLPNDMGLLINLQYLNSSRCSELEKLPEDMRNLINLQHLDISFCWGLKELPKDMRLLVSLQHLNVSGCSLEKLPEDIGFLINLQHLDISFCWGLKELPKDMRLLIHLQHLNISGCSLLEMLPEDIRYLINLELYDDTKLRYLDINGYKGNLFSDWQLLFSPFCNMESLILKDCKNCIRLPPLGQLTRLKGLEISGMDGITEVGAEFYGNSSICKPFQVLEILRIKNMAEWTTWNMHPDNADFLSLNELYIRGCPKLVGDIPFRLTSLRTLVMMISDCPSISLYFQSCDLKRLEVDNCKHVEFLPDDICNWSLELLNISGSTETIPLFSFSELQRLSIGYLEGPSMYKIPNGYHQSLTSLQSLEIVKCNNILSFPEGGLPAPNLKILHINDCSKLKSLPEQMNTQLSSLCDLSINNCPEMESFPDGGLPHSLERLIIHGCEKVTMLPRNWGLQRLPSLTELEILGIEDKSFPEEGLLPATLQRLEISHCPNLEALNHKGFQYITSLKELSIAWCRELRYLPEDGLPLSLSQLRIFNCPKLAARIEREKGEEWPKISHIPIIELEQKLIS